MGKGHDIVPKRGYCGNLPHRCSDASSTAPRERGTCAEDSLRSTENSCPNSKTAPPRQHWIQESPIISPDPESGRSPRCYSAKRSQKGGRPPSFAISPKPRPCPESPVSPNITIRQEMVQGKWGILATDPRGSHECLPRTPSKVIRSRQDSISADLHLWTI